MSEPIEDIPGNDDETADGLPQIPRMTPHQVDAAVAFIESLEPTDHIDVEAEILEIRCRQRMRRERAFRAFDEMAGHDPDGITDEQLTEYLDREGAFEGWDEDARKLQTLRLIQELRRRRN